MFVLVLGANYSKVGSFKDGTQVNIYRYEGDWAYVSSGSITGYVNSYYLATPSSGKKIAIDAGHGGSDTGAIGNGLLEKEINLSIALKVESLLKQKGIQVVMTRNNDTFISLDGRVAKAVNANADVLLVFIQIQVLAQIQMVQKLTIVRQLHEQKIVNNWQPLSKIVCILL